VLKKEKDIIKKMQRSIKKKGGGRESNVKRDEQRLIDTLKHSWEVASELLSTLKFAW